MMKTINFAEWKKNINLVKKGRTILLELFSSGCGACAWYEKNVLIPLEPELKKHKVDILRMQADNNDAFIQEYEVNAVPTSFVFGDKQNLLGKFVGSQSKSSLLSWLESLLVLKS